MEKAEAHFLYLRIQRCHYWQQVDEGIREDASWEQKEATKCHFMLRECEEIFEYLQQKNRWADTLLFQAEEHMWSISPDWCEE